MRVVLATRDDLAHAALFLALLRSGITAVILNPESRATELAALIDAADPSALVMDAHLVARVLPEQSARVAVITLDDAGGPGLEAMLSGEAAADPPQAIDAEGTAYILFTSGTTSRPKGVEITHRALFAQMATFVRQYGFGARTRLMNLLPLHHTDGLTQGVVVAACAGATLLRPMRIRVYQVGEIVDACHELRATHLVAVPSLLALMMSLGDRYQDALRTDWFRFVISTAAYLDPGLWQRFEETFGVQVVNVYGLTETVCETTYCGPDAATRRIGTIGKPVDAELRIVDDRGTPAGARRRGRTAVRGPHVMNGLLSRARGNGEGIARRLVPHRRPRDRRCRRLLPDRRPQEGRDHHRRHQRLPGRRERRAAHRAGHRRRSHDRPAGRALGRDGRQRPRRAAAGTRPRTGHRGPFPAARVAGEITRGSSTSSTDLPRGPAGKVVKAELARLIAERRAATRHEAHAGGMRDRVLQVAAEAFKCRGRCAVGCRYRPSVDGWTSLAHVEFLMALELEFSFTDAAARTSCASTRSATRSRSSSATPARAAATRPDDGDPRAVLARMGRRIRRHLLAAAGAVAALGHRRLRAGISRDHGPPSALILAAMAAITWWAGVRGGERRLGVGAVVVLLLGMLAVFKAAAIAGRRVRDAARHVVLHLSLRALRARAFQEEPAAAHRRGIPRLPLLPADR